MAGKSIIEMRVYPDAVIRIVGGMSQRASANAANATVTRTKANIRRAGRIDTGRMLEGTRAEPDRTSTPMKPVFVVSLGGDGYGVFQEFGTRAHGPRNAKFMRFVPKGKIFAVYAKWVRGVTPGNFLRDAVEAARPSDYT